uniref:Uncharacterized protein n=1 Tax=Castor canadensis TaxID=51338 RepID=A0A8C0XQ04_CASCN
MDRVPLVCDYGSAFSKVGYAGTEAPLDVFPTILGKLRHDNLLVGTEEEDWFIGDEVQKNRGKLNLHYPIFRGAINWDHLEKVWHYSFYKVLHVNPEHQPLMMTESPLSTLSAKERASQILFETFNVPALHLANQGVLSLYASGQTSGTTIESGEDMTFFVPIIDGCPLNQSIMQLDVAGQDLTSYLLQLLTDGGNFLVGTADRECIRDVKEKCCYVALDFSNEKSETDWSACQKKVQLPDGQEVSLGQETFFCPEILFQSKLIGRNTPGIHKLTVLSITSCDTAFWKALFGHIVLSGGTGSCSGLRQRLQREICKLICPHFNVKVATSPYAKYGAWVGGSILCSLSTCKDMWFTSDEYKDMGSSIIKRRSF